MSKRKASDGVKLDLLQQIQRDAEFGINSIDVKKLENLQTTLIASLDDPILKRRLLEQIKNDFNRAKIIATLDEATIRKYISTIESESALSYILSEATISDELKIEYINKIKDNTKKTTVLISINNDKIKREYIDKLDYSNKVRVIISLENDELKEDYLEEITNENDRIEIIASINSDDIKESYFKSIKDDRDAAYILGTFKSDDIKEYYIRSLYYPEDKVAVIKSFASDELKIQYLSEAKTQEQVVEILEVLGESEEKIKLTEDIDDVYLKTVVMATIEDDETKINFLKSLEPTDLEDESLKIRALQVIRGLGKYEDKIRYSSLMKLEDRASVIATITGGEKDFPEEKIQYFQELVDDFIYTLEDGTDFKDLSMEEFEIEMKSIEAKISSANDSMKKALIEKVILLQRILAEKDMELKRMQGELEVTNEIGGVDEK